MDKFLNVGSTTPPDPTSPVASLESSLSLTSSAISSSNRKRKRLSFDVNDGKREAPDGKK